MAEKKCKKCGSKTTQVSLEAEFDVHIHDQCINNPDHPYFCRNEKRWIGK